MSPEPIRIPQSQSVAPGAEPINPARCEQILAAINRFSLPIVQQITDKDPTHKFGREKYDHMHELASKDIGAEISELASLPAHEQLLLKIILRAHDLGRHIEALRKLGLAADTQWELASDATENDLLRSEKRHGFLSTAWLEREGVLNQLLPAEKQIVLDAVKWHAEKVVPLDPDSVAYKLCYVLRDLDKLSIFEDDYLAPEFICSQMMHYEFKLRPGGFEMTGASSDNPELLNVVNGALERKDYSPPEDPAWAATVASILNDEVPANWISEFAKRTSLPIAAVKDGYGAYMLMSLAMVFDLHYPSMREKIMELANFQNRLEFVLARVPAVEDQQKIRAALGID